ncbi:hypothetical protein MWN34_10620 [Ancylobacter sp. 6x-1]|uniref:Uncharacterized protein n=1 Tax=Ancylobacter crimeensis TaxID=2579147 RepID=A0ABT0DBN3_9HYPH|nr:hypothetical protein [Ancylobacter crimeensis]MCK0197365.1 hypothetical protein [Ancylobacter crimeensis]
MYLHVDLSTFADDLRDVVASFAKIQLATDKHASLSRSLLDAKHPNPKQARFTVVANCADCGTSLHRNIETIWQRRSPVQFSLTEKTCPHCRGQGGFHYAKTQSLHA